jgi:hypothetical protein
MRVWKNRPSNVVKRPTCVTCGEVMSLACLEPYTIGEVLWEDWIFDCDCGRIEKRPKKVAQNAPILHVLPPP